MSTIVDQFGRPIDRSMLHEPQTAAIRALENQYLTPMLDGLSPARLAATLRAADSGDLIGQHRLFADMEERDPHLCAEMGKRKLALLNLDWDIVPPRNATDAEKASAEWVKEVIGDGVDDFEDLVLACMDGVGHGFAGVELAWRQDGREWLPEFFPRPQEWFQLTQDRTALRLRDGSADGAALAQFGWILHEHGKAKTGYIARMGIYRVLAWPFLYKAYGIGDFAEFLESYGLPIIVGKYAKGATAAEKASLLRSVTALGHDARAIMPADMILEVQKITGGATGGGSHLDMVSWADRAQSKCILGGTLTSQADGKTSTNALGNVHQEVRHDILEADARQIAGTLTRHLVYPLVALNRGRLDSLRRCPRLEFDTGVPEDLVAYADALPKLAGLFSIPASWVRDRLHIPEAADGEEVLGVQPPGGVDGDDGKQVPALPTVDAPSAEELAALAATTGGAVGTKEDSLRRAQGAVEDGMTAEIDWQHVTTPLFKPILDALKEGLDPEEILARMGEWFPMMNDDQLVEALSRAIFVADCWGRLSAGAND
ncbi:MAG TPA: DUF935 domain-containing protein [Candidatus Accumulibacter phosphatis]|nr:MAG: Mu-like prophage protein gp29 [Candidatus Accumulibacter sp. SK-11]HAY29315.1 DUF935 domain-containing protein [Accumulibacter sp.]HCN68582.1 DUF935 domain-containing protein [Accumulibacter sp.]HRL76275.1 DUF935 domain-containing protein [Candidatus Accumulibacter phosphatis]HRQ94871.1 DUF935 domain-containing protein [Candidatus Accumulibacter phosphatis]